MAVAFEAPDVAATRPVMPAMTGITKSFKTREYTKRSAGAPANGSDSHVLGAQRIIPPFTEKNQYALVYPSVQIPPMAKRGDETRTGEPKFPDRYQVARRLASQAYVNFHRERNQLEFPIVIRATSRESQRHPEIPKYYGMYYVVITPRVVKFDRSEKPITATFTHKLTKLNKDKVDKKEIIEDFLAGRIDSKMQGYVEAFFQRARTP
jgi:hypothetical protein